MITTRLSILVLVTGSNLYATGVRANFNSLRNQKPSPICATKPIANGLNTANQNLMFSGEELTTHRPQTLQKRLGQLQSNSMPPPQWMLQEKTISPLTAFAATPTRLTNHHSANRDGGNDAATAVVISDTADGALFSDFGDTSTKNDAFSDQQPLGETCANFFDSFVFGSPDSWYTFSLSEQTLVQATLTGVTFGPAPAFSTIAILNSNLVIQANVADCLTCNPPMAQCCLDAGTYYIIVDATSSGKSGTYTMEAGFTNFCPCENYTVTPLNIPAQVLGTITGASNVSGFLSGDVFYEFTPLEPCQLRISTCNPGTDFDTILRLWQGADCLTQFSGNLLASNDDDLLCQSGNRSSTITVSNFTPGETLTLQVESFADSLNGNFELSIECLPPCTPVCDGLPSEGETAFAGDDFLNGGCNSPDQGAFQSVSCDIGFCGTFFTFIGDSNMVDSTAIGAQIRDTDWFEFSTIGQGHSTINVSAESCSEFNLVVMEPDCAGGAILASTTGTAISTSTDCLPEGTYWLVIQPSAFSGLETPVSYQVELTCTPGCAPCADFVCPPIDPVVGFHVSGTTTGAPLGPGTVGPSRAYCFSSADEFTLEVETCFPGTDYDSDTYLFRGDPCNGGSLVFYNDGAVDCEFAYFASGFTEECLAPGDYTLVIGGYLGGTGNFEIDIHSTACIPCRPAMCTGLATEGEAVYSGIDYFNGGCNVPDTQSFTSISSSQEWCGDFFTYVSDSSQSSERDEDWYEIALTDNSTRLSIEVESCADFQVSLLSGGCDSLAIIEMASGADTLLTVSAECLTAGTYFVVMTPSVFSGMAEPVNYRAKVTSGPCCTGGCDNNFWYTAIPIQPGETVCRTTMPCLRTWFDWIPPANLLCPWIGILDGNSTWAPDQWFRLSLADPTEILVDLCNSSYDTSVILFNYTGSNPQGWDIVSGNDDHPDCGPQSQFQCQIPAGEYLLMVAGRNGSRGNFELRLNSLNLPCAPVTDLTISTSGDHISLSWDPVENASTYILQIAPDGNFNSSTEIILGNVNSVIQPIAQGNIHYRVRAICP